MKTLNLTQANVQSKLILAVALIAAVAATSLAFQNGGGAKNTAIAMTEVPVQQVVIAGKRMTAEEKLAYDLAPKEIARVEIIGQRLSADEKVAMLAEDEINAKHAAAHRKA
ncbi:hypothetical protein S2091_0460 [Solimicrobium silvestre]|uniref:Uncharacterized protein n=2 Tax=Solimicrobium silvestre TaxID=2099400 RepID=A0A2S9H5K1_9BURK|nr:hypothetical protein S2091_0460 [Solimicrobium silvestre]